MSADEFFQAGFEALTGSPPFPWQRALFVRFVSEHTDNIPESCNLPTGLGKTSVVAIWLLALVYRRDKMPRRLVYVVNRRTVVDQTTDEVERLRENLSKLSPRAWFPELAVSTLRGQFADNREWSANPARPAVICGTVDMIGSRLLFSGYGVGWKAKPLHAGFLGQDTLLIHDEAHLEPAFQKLIDSIRGEQVRSQEFRTFHVMELTATSRGGGKTFTLTDDDKKNDTVHQRIHATKKLHLEPMKDPKKLADQIAARALQFQDSGLAILVFVRTVEDVLNVRDKLPKDQVEMLTGTLRGKERDDLVKKPVFRRFLPKPPDDAAQGTVYLICTSAGEVGVNISADHLVCDLSTFESMAQRFGRVNRFGNRTDTEIHVIYPTKFEEKVYDQRRAKTYALLQQLNGDASPDALGELPEDDRRVAFAPTPTILPTSDILFDAWALTTITGKLPGRPPVEPYLHGLPTDWQPPETCVAWREEVGQITEELLNKYEPETFLDEYPLLPRELLREPSYRAFNHFAAMAKRLDGQNVPVWLLDAAGSVETLMLAELADKNAKDRIDWKTVILPPSAGGLNGGMLSAASLTADDVADTDERQRIWNDYPDDGKRFRRVITVDFSGVDDDDETDSWNWFVRVKDNEGGSTSNKPVLWHVHVEDVEREAAKIVDALPLPEDLKLAVKRAATYHDHGKKRALFQRFLGNINPNIWLAKSGSKKGGKFQETYRHEFGSLLDIEQELESLKLGEHQDLVLHLIAAHHGRARPHFPADDVFDPENSPVEAERIASEVPRRFARLQRKYGRWGLAYLESLLRAGDWAASSNPSDFWQEGQ